MNSTTACLLLAGATALLCACSQQKPATPRAPESVRAVTVARVESRALASAASASGLLVAREEAAVGVEQAGVRVLRVLVEEGARVRAGQPLAVLDDALLRERLAQARAQAAQAGSEAERVRGLDGSGVMSEEEIGRRRSQARIAQAQLRELETQSRQTTVRAPVSGVVIERSARPGSLSGGEPLFRIVRDDQVELDAEVPETAILGIEPGQPVAVTLADGQVFAGRVRLVSPRIDPKTKLGRVRVALPVDADLRVGGFARAAFAGRSAPVATVPEKAVHFEASGPQLTLIDRDDRARRVAVKTGRRSGGVVELLQGPPVGSRVALAGGAFLIDGDRVRPEPVVPEPVAPEPVAPTPHAPKPASAAER
ncbi:efflux transporter, RND family, MFP subunit [Lysobacter enzymogenes]|uniref:Efflux transporter, RND family, MFP subunit n=1 Tax=Lysobacter enzymogenes TaxID=69 RepID=A0A0S2DH10_LYSEN|nr:efflux RND transporter periplasmic adaptor subunit [Lysobacter enzymogenes]ALN57916.1 efflux transporter, RND family, MFP subunit [Lysobacter enzymogenes]